MMPDDRFQRWVDASSAAGAIEPSMTALVQGLGRFDCRLIEEDARFTLSIRSNHRRRTKIVSPTD